MELRKEVNVYAEQMEKELRNNDWKPGWKGDDPMELLEHLEEEVYEVRKELENGPKNNSTKNIRSWIHRIQKECADVGNMAMMISDVESETLSLPEFNER